VSLGTDIPIECPLCSKECQTTLETIDARNPIKCGACGKSFAIGDVFERLYNEEPLVRGSVDALAKYAASQSELKASSKQSREAAEQLLKQIKFEDLVCETARQILVHGDAFLRIEKKATTVNWELMPPARVIVKTSWAKDPRWKTPELKEDKFVLAEGKRTRGFTPDNVVHFKRMAFSYEQVPYGRSMIQICLSPLHYLRQFRASPAGSRPDFQWWSDHLERQVMYGLMVPEFVLARNPRGVNLRTAQFVVPVFVGVVNELKDMLSDGFDDALARFAKQKGLKSAAKIEFGRLDGRRVLIDCGFDFSEDVRALKGLYDTGIINKEQLDRMLQEYSPSGT
jgi:transcription elongation factor Elf1